MTKINHFTLISNPNRIFSRTYLQIIQVVLTAALLLLFQSSPVLSQDGTVPFHPGEKLDYELKWTLIPAGKASLEVLPIKQIDGQDAYHFVLTAESNSFVDMIYKVRDRIEGFTDIGMTHSVLYKKKQKEGPTKREIIVTFDWKKYQAQYTNYDDKHKPVELVPGAFDPLSAFFYSRLLDLTVNSQVSRPVTDGKTCILGKAKVIKKETVTVQSGTFDTVLVEPDIEHVGGVFEKSKDAKIRIWLTADERKIPVKLESKVIVGHFTGELVTRIDPHVEPNGQTHSAANASAVSNPVNSYE